MLVNPLLEREPVKTRWRQQALTEQKKVDTTQGATILGSNEINECIILYSLICFRLFYIVFDLEHSPA